MHAVLRQAKRDPDGPDALPVNQKDVAGRYAFSLATGAGVDMPDATTSPEKMQWLRELSQRDTSNPERTIKHADCCQPLGAGSSSDSHRTEV